MCSKAKVKEIKRKGLKVARVTRTKVKIKPRPKDKEANKVEIETNRKDNLTNSKVIEKYNYA